MRTTGLVPTALVFTAVIAGCGGEAAPLSTEDVAAIQSLVQRFPEYGLSKNWDAMVAMNTENTVWLPPGAPALEGRQALRAFLEAYPVITDFRVAAVEVDGRGDLAFARGTYSITVATAPAPGTATEVGKWVLILRKQPDGSWMVASDIWNSDSPPSP